MRQTGQIVKYKIIPCKENSLMIYFLSPLWKALCNSNSFSINHTYLPTPPLKTFAQRIILMIFCAKKYLIKCCWVTVLTELHILLFHRRQFLSKLPSALFFFKCLLQESLFWVWIIKNTGSISVSGQLPTYPSPNPTLTLTCYQLTVVELGEG